MKSRFVFNENYGVSGVGGSQPYCYKPHYEREEEQCRQQHVKAECGAEIKLIGSSFDDARQCYLGTLVLVHFLLPNHLALATVLFHQKPLQPVHQ